MSTPISSFINGDVYPVISVGYISNLANIIDKHDIRINSLVNQIKEHENSLIKQVILNVLLVGCIIFTYLKM